MLRHGQQGGIGQGFVKQGGVATAPTVNGLLDVSDPGERTALAQGFQHERVQGQPLFPAGVLKFVHQNVRQT